MEELTQAGLGSALPDRALWSKGEVILEIGAERLRLKQTDV
jgi:hypothetical protein